MTYESDYQLSLRHVPEAKLIIAPWAIVIGSPEDDMKRNSDLVVLSGTTVRIGLRVRRFKWINVQVRQRSTGWQFTIRQGRPQSGAETEDAKIMAGWGRYFVYGFEGPDPEKLCRWFVVDYDRFRAARRGGLQPSDHRSTGDGSAEFDAYNIDEPSVAACLLAKESRWP